MIALAADHHGPIVTTMPARTFLPSTQITPSTPRRRFAVRSSTTAGLLALAMALLAIPAAHGKATDTTVRRQLGGCTLTPSADVVAFDVTALLMTVRSHDGVIEMLHDAHCTDGRVGTVWIAADVI